MNETNQSKYKLVKYIVGAILAIILGFWLKPFQVIDAGHRGVVLRFGEVDRVMDEGLNWRTPIAEKIREIDVRIQKEEVDASAASKDLQDVTSKVALNYHVDAQRVDALWKEIGSDFKVRIIDPAIQESVKAATAKYTAEELITKRETVRDNIKKELTERLAPRFLVVTDVSIVNFSFSPSFNAAIESKVTAQQRALEAQNKLEQIKFEAAQKIASAQAEAESVRLQAQALSQNPQFIELRRLEVELKRSERWNGILPVNIYGSAPIPFLNINP